MAGLSEGPRRARSMLIARSMSGGRSTSGDPGNGAGRSRAGRDPLGKRALFSAAPGTGADDPPVRQAQRARRPVRGDTMERRGPIVIECSACRAVSEVGPVAFTLLQFPLGYWVPRGRFGHRMICPACRQRVWAGVSLTLGGRRR